MPIAEPKFLPAEQEARLISLLRGQSAVGDPAELREAASRAGVAGAIARLSGDERTLAVQEMSHRRGLHWLRKVGTGLDAAGVRFVVLKGFPLSERLYEPGYLRHSGDLDVLIDPRDFSRAHAVALANGFTPSETYHGFTTRMLGHDAAYDHASAPSLELHVRLHSRFGIRPAAAPFLERAVWQTLSDGRRVRVLGRADDFVHLAAHATAHQWSKLRWLYDLYLFLERNAEMDWDEVARRTAELRVWPAVLLTCAVLENEWGTVAPLTRLAGGRYGEAKALLPRVRYMEWEGSNADKTRLIFQELALCGGPMEKARHLARGFSYPLLRRLREGWGGRG